MQVSLPPAQQRFVKKLVSSGRFGSDAEVVRASLRLLERQERQSLAEIDEFRAKVEAGLEQVRQGRLVDGEAAFARLRSRSAARKKRMKRMKQ